MKIRKRRKLLNKQIYKAGAFNRGVWKVLEVLRDTNYKMSRALHDAYTAARGQG